ncbi:hypothetical protein [Roseomonas sp. BN140053]|uniref:hypothetical protein n=1 Tax=Roseomonas sp. BN140053 TaxID=3391898 RepID=UPI0039E95172
MRHTRPFQALPLPGRSGHRMSGGGSLWLAALLVFGLPAAAAEPAAGDAPGRFQAVAAAGAPGAPGTVVLLDTHTGQSWVLVQTAGPPVQWAPVRYWTPGTPPVLQALPPAPATVGSRPATSEATPPGNARATAPGR